MFLFPNRKVYIGKTVNLKNRLRAHRRPCRGNSKYPVSRAFRKYGWDEVTKIILEQFNDEDTDAYMSEREVYYIKHYGAYGKGGYNCTKGGEGVTGFRHSEETRKSMKDAYAKMSPEKKEKYARLSYENARRLMKPVRAISKDGEIFEFECIGEAVRKLTKKFGKKFLSGTISLCANKRYRYKTHHGFRFEFIH